MYSACNIYFLYYYFERFVSIWKLEWRERRFNFERDVREIQSDKEPKPTEHILEIWILGNRGKFSFYRGEKTNFVHDLFWLARCDCVGESEAQLRCLPLPLPGLMLTVWLNGGNETATMAITAAHHTQALARPGITRRYTDILSIWHFKYCLFHSTATSSEN